MECPSDMGLRLETLSFDVHADLRKQALAACQPELLTVFDLAATLASVCAVRPQQLQHDTSI